MSTIPRSLRSLLLTTTLLFSLGSCNPSLVLAYGWSQIASTCTPDDNALPTLNRRIAVKYDFQGAAFQFKSWALSTRNWLGTALPITARCNVATTLEEGQLHLWQNFIVSYQDPDGPGMGSRVIAHLVRSFRPSGSQVIAVFDSNTYAPTGAVVVDQSIAFDNMDLDFNNSDYFVEINLYRTTFASNPRVLRVRLE